MFTHFATGHISIAPETEQNGIVNKNKIHNIKMSVLEKKNKNEGLCRTWSYGVTQITLKFGNHSNSVKSWTSSSQRSLSRGSADSIRGWLALQQFTVDIYDIMQESKT